jgi:Putative MetA-pathway of phenol degradation
MRDKPLSPKILALVFGIAGAAQVARAEPPFVTDDPEPTEYRHWEIFLGSEIAHDSVGWSGEAPHVEIDYGAMRNLELSVIAPLAFNTTSNGRSQFGYGDTELEVKYRFVQERACLPQVAGEPQVELPTGDAKRGLGDGHTQVFLPLWLQKSSGPWTTYGGGGYWINPGTENRHWWFAGCVVERQLSPRLTVGLEVFHETAKQENGTSDTKFNVGTIFNLSDNYHLLFSVGHTMEGPSEFQAFAAFQITFGPREAAASTNK